MNGTQYSGGHGSKLDLSTILMKNFVLTPGKGGEPGGGFYSKSVKIIFFVIVVSLVKSSHTD